MANKNPPRKTTIRGQRHLLAYITPGEAELLKAHGGSGELHNGIPSYPPGFGGERSGFGAERAGGAAGGKSGAAGRDTDQGRDRSGPRGRGGGRARAGMSTARSSGGQFGGGGRERLRARADVQKQMLAAKKSEEAAALKARNQGLLENFLGYMNPGKRINAVQNMAAQFMGQKFLDVLETDPQATVVRSNGRVVGVRDQYGRLTGRDPAQERERQGRDGPERETAEERRRRLAAATTPKPDAETPTLGKRVIRTELAKETEAERLAGRRLGRRSLLSRSTTLGA